MLTFLQQIGFGYLTGKKRTLRLHIWHVFAKFFYRTNSGFYKDIYIC